MDIIPQIYTARVMHRRLFPKVNAFTYRVYYLAVPLPADPLPGHLQRFPADDLGYRDGRCPGLWAKDILKTQHIAEDVTSIMLLTMPRVLGYVFNPVSFYFCLNARRELIAIIHEVHNTFGEQHSYVCLHADKRPIAPDEWMQAQKLFHVSPFLQRSGSYRFRVQLQVERIGIWIDYLDQQGNIQLQTSLTGHLSPLTRASLFRAFWTHPMITLKAIALIHWQALKLVAKGIKYIPKPKALPENLTLSGK